MVAFLPKVLLLGAGRFGQHYVRLLKKLADEQNIVFLGVVVRSQDSAVEIAKKYQVAVYTDLSNELLTSVDAVLITTPPETHVELVARCIKYAHVLVEKPIAMSSVEVDPLITLAENSAKVLMVGHILRFHPLTHELKRLLRNTHPPTEITGKFLNPCSSDQGRDPSLELLHLHDVIEAVWPMAELRGTFRRDVGRVAKVSMLFGNETKAFLELGWLGEEKTRRLVFAYPDRRIIADYLKNTITITNSTSESVVTTYTPQKELLEVELETFFSACSGKVNNPIPASLGKKIIGWAEGIGDRDVSQHLPTKRLRVAVIGGGVFGCNAAIALAKNHNVTLYERNSSLLKEGAWANCFRHHAGYHYPRSDETVRDIQMAAASFEAWYQDALITGVPTYYGLARRNSHIDLQNFRNFCDRLGLDYKEVTDDVFSDSEVMATIKVNEPCYHYETLVGLVTDRLNNPNISVCLNSNIQEVKILPNGVKQLVIEHHDGNFEREEFDVVINATYAAVNWFTTSLGVSPVPIRVDWAEVVIVNLPHPPVSLTVIDGPFACLLPTGNPNEFTLYHVVESVLERYTPVDGMIRPLISQKTNALAIYEKSLPYFPFLREGKITGSRQVHRGVQAHREHDDKRVAEIYEHGFDCYSILSGKIISSVALAQQLATMIDNKAVTSP
jgi:hypothetical protein